MSEKKGRRFGFAQAHSCRLCWRHPVLPTLRSSFPPPGGPRHTLLEKGAAARPMSSVTPPSRVIHCRFFLTVSF